MKSIYMGFTLSRFKLLFSITALLCINSPVFAAAFQFYELGTPIIGTAAVGQAAEATDASTTYFNPAGMVELNQSQYLLGSQVILPHTHFKKNQANTISGDNGGNAATLIPGMGMYYVYSISPQLKTGISLTSPYGGLLDYNDGWVGRYTLQNTQFFTLNLNPTLAYRLNHWAALGIGGAIEYADMHETIALPLQPDIDGQATLRLHNTALGYNIGLLFTPKERTKLGVAYRSQISHRFKGNTTFYRIAVIPQTSTKMIMPQNIIISLSQVITPKMTLLAEGGWSNWSSMKNSTVNIHGLTATTILDWQDTYRIGLGGQFKATPALLIQAGASYDSSPTKTSRRLPDLPMDKQIRLGTGIIYSIGQAIQLGFSYEYINFGKAKIHNTSFNGTLAGDYPTNNAQIAQASINVTV